MVRVDRRRSGRDDGDHRGQTCRALLFFLYPLLSKFGSPTFGPRLFEAKKKRLKIALKIGLKMSASYFYPIQFTSVLRTHLRNYIICALYSGQLEGGGDLLKAEIATAKAGILSSFSDVLSDSFDDSVMDCATMEIHLHDDTRMYTCQLLERSLYTLRTPLTNS